MELLLSITIFVALGAIFVFVNLVMGAVARPKIPNPEKSAVYECGEPTIGSSWVQFDLRFYIVALVYLIFDVEVALFYPWAVAYGSADKMGVENGMSTFAIRQVALVDMLFFCVVRRESIAPECTVDDRPRRRAFAAISNRI